MSRVIIKRGRVVDDLQIFGQSYKWDGVHLGDGVVKINLMCLKTTLQSCWCKPVISFGCVMFFCGFRFVGSQILSVVFFKAARVQVGGWRCSWCAAITVRIHHFNRLKSIFKSIHVKINFKISPPDSISIKTYIIINFKINKIN